MNTKLWIITLSTTLTVACSAEPEGDDPLVVMWDEPAATEDTNDQPDSGTTGSDPDEVDMGTPDVGRSDEPDLATVEPDQDMPVQPTGNVCQTKDAPVQLINTCVFEWSSCEDGTSYAFECDIQNVAGNVFSLCNCFENGVMDEADKIVDICGAADWAEVEAIVNEECGWDLR